MLLFLLIREFGNLKEGREVHFLSWNQCSGDQVPRCYNLTINVSRIFNTDNCCCVYQKSVSQQKFVRRRFTKKLYAVPFLPEHGSNFGSKVKLF